MLAAGGQTAVVDTKQLIRNTNYLVNYINRGVPVWEEP
jgi:hypothetical protein